MGRRPTQDSTCSPVPKCCRSYFCSRKPLVLPQEDAPSCLVSSLLLPDHTCVRFAFSEALFLTDSIVSFQFLEY